MSLTMLRLAIHAQTRFVLVRPHYPENVGAAARAMKTMGFTDLAIVKPGRVAEPSHVMARKMAVKSLDVLDASPPFPTLAAALSGFDHVYGTTARRGVSGVLTLRDAALDLLARTKRGERVAILFGNEKTGLSEEDLYGAPSRLRIPMAADQPSINLGQAVQLVAYELFTAALIERARLSPDRAPERDR